jgi:hypothetical protein
MVLGHEIGGRRSAMVRIGMGEEGGIGARRQNAGLRSGKEGKRSRAWQRRTNYFAALVFFALLT